MMSRTAREWTHLHRRCAVFLSRTPATPSTTWGAPSAHPTPVAERIRGIYVVLIGIGTVPQVLNAMATL